MVEVSYWSRRKKNSSYKQRDWLQQRQGEEKKEVCGTRSNSMVLGIMHEHFKKKKSLMLILFNNSYRLPPLCQKLCCVQDIEWWTDQLWSISSRSLHCKREFNQVNRHWVRINHDQVSSRIEKVGGLWRNTELFYADCSSRVKVDALEEDSFTLSPASRRGQRGGRESWTWRRN